MASKKFIPPSELIINDRGAIYHLDVCPGELADTIITVGDPQRVARVSRHFDRIEHQIQHREFLTHTGWLGKKRLSVVGTGIGPDNIDIVINEVDAVHNIDFSSRKPKSMPTELTIIRIGTSGSLQTDIPVDTWVASTHGLGLDNLLAYYAGSTPYFDAGKSLVGDIGMAVQPYLVESDPQLLLLFNDPLIQQGITVTSPGFYGPQGRTLRLQPSRPVTQLMQGLTHAGQRVTNFEMETAAIYGLAKLCGHRALSLNAILANRAANTFSKSPLETIDRLIEWTLAKLES
ncbi:MAG: nucleoside phosphorylase [Saprospiraceae bacterium]|nr:nucleoside phosphorylase [Saprospiraceae bacterium]